MAALVGRTCTMGTSRSVSANEIVRAATEVHRRLIQTNDRALDGGPDAAMIRGLVESVAPLLSTGQVESVIDRVSDLLFGLGPLEPILNDPAITEVMVNGPGPVWVEREGVIEATATELTADVLDVIIERVVAPLGLRVDRTSPFVDARLADGSRVNVAVPPLALDGPYLTVRRFRDQAFTLADFCTGDVLDLLARAVTTRQSLVVSGGTGSGKTSLLNALGARIPDSERVITIEDAAELRLPGTHTVRLEARPANAEGVGEVTIRSLLRNALRMRPDRLVIGEVRGGEALDLMQAMNTGHAGSMSTCHANSPEDAIRRLEAMSLMSDVALPADVVRTHLLAAIDLIIHVVRDSNGRRRVMSIDQCSIDGPRPLVRAGRVVSREVAAS